jgi:hypothetical protein
MNKIDYWFLDTAIEEPIGCCWIFPNGPNGTLAINRRPLQLSLSEISEVMYRLFQEEKLLAIRPNHLNEIRKICHQNQIKITNKIFAKTSFIPSYEEIKRALQQLNDGYFIENNFSYFLTEKGGELWEFLSKPKWKQYISGGIGEFDSILYCSSRETLEKYMQNHNFFNYYGDGNMQEPILETATWKTMIPWLATYWKTLPCGYELNYQVKTIKIDEKFVSSQEFIERERKVTNWKNEIHNWYTNYYKC